MLVASNPGYEMMLLGAAAARPPFLDRRRRAGRGVATAGTFVCGHTRISPAGPGMLGAFVLLAVQKIYFAAADLVVGKPKAGKAKKA